jgi:primosomal replication protein N
LGYRIYVKPQGFSEAVPVNIPADVFGKIDDSANLNIGATVEVEGKFTKNVMRNYLQLNVKDAADVDVLFAPTSNARRYQLGAMNGNDYKARVQVEGTIAFTEPAGDGGTFAVIGDGTGAQRVWLSETMARTLPLEKGARINVQGFVDAQKKNGIWIVPILPSDVKLVR